MTLQVIDKLFSEEKITLHWKVTMCIFFFKILTKIERGGNCVCGT